jgi:hypothetical protein
MKGKDVGKSKRKTLQENLPELEGLEFKKEVLTYHLATKNENWKMCYQIQDTHNKKRDHKCFQREKEVEKK